MAANKSFGQKLRDERNKQGRTVQEVAENCGVSRSYLTLIENGRRLPGKKNIPLIASALKLKTIVVLNWYLEELERQIKLSLGD